jgi:hypothetical protein
MRPALPAVLAWLAAAPAGAGEVFSYIDQPLPETVVAQTECADDLQPYPTRRAFAAGVVFAIRCPGNNANYVEALVWAHDETGAGARLLLFPTPRSGDGEDPLDSLSNIRWISETAEVAQIFVNPEETICRTEGRWRIGEGEPELVHWRQTADCDGSGGWEVVVDRSAKGTAE